MEIHVVEKATGKTVRIYTSYEKAEKALHRLCAKLGNGYQIELRSKFV
jgi:hypothetical protein